MTKITVKDITIENKPLLFSIEPGYYPVKTLIIKFKY